MRGEYLTFVALLAVLPAFGQQPDPNAQYLPGFQNAVRGVLRNQFQMPASPVSPQAQRPNPVLTLRTAGGVPRPTVVAPSQPVVTNQKCAIRLVEAHVRGDIDPGIFLKNVPAASPDNQFVITPSVPACP
jgi:hypothetical protein